MHASVPGLDLLNNTTDITVPCFQRVVNGTNFKREAKYTNINRVRSKSTFKTLKPLKRGETIVPPAKETSTKRS